MSQTKSFDEFFKHVDGQIAAADEAKAAEAEAAPAKRAFVEKAVSSATSVAESYAEALKTRGMSALVESYPTGVSFTLSYNNGRKRVLQFVKGLEGDFLEIWFDAPNNEKPNFRSTPGTRYMAENYNDDVYAGYLQKLVDEHLFYAQRHGGVR